MAIDQEFQAAVARVAGLRNLSNDTLLSLYGLYKQATHGDVTGSRPSAFDLKGRAKHDAWTSRRGMTKDQAMTAYVAAVAALK